MFGNKGKEVKESIDNEFSMDNDLDMDDFEVDFNDPPDDRHPMTKVASAAVSGVISGAFDEQLIGEKLKDTLPEGYGKTYDLADKVAETAGKTYDDSVKAVKPAVKEFKKTILKAIPTDSKYLPGFAAETLKEWSEDVAEKKSAKQEVSEIREGAISSQIGAIFNAQMAQAESMRAEDQTREAVGEAVTQERHKQSIGLASRQDQSLSRIDQYLRTVNVEYQKKDLELSYRQLFALQDILKASELSTQLQADNLPAITKNTGLPDFVKQHNAEFLAEYQKRRFADAIGQGLFGNTAEYLERGMGNLSKNIVAEVTKFAREAKDGLSQIGGLLELGGGGGDIGPGKEEMAGALAGGAVGEEATNRLYEWMKEKGYTDKLGKNETVVKYGGKLSGFVRNAPRKIADTQRAWAREADDGSIVGFLKKFGARAFGKAATEQDVGVKTTNTLSMPHDITFKTINEIMPGYMSRMLNELVLIRKGQAEGNNQEEDRLVYDYDRGDFVTRAELKKNLTEKMAPELGVKAFDEKLSKLMALMGVNKLAPGVQTTIREGVARASADMKEATPENLTDPKLYRGADRGKAVEFMGEYLNRVAEDDEERKRFEIAYNAVAEGLKNNRHDTARHVDLGQTNELKELGFINKEGNATSHGTLDYYLRKLADPVQEKKKKKQPPPRSVPPVNRRGGPPNLGGGRMDPIQAFAKGGVLDGINDLSGKVFNNEKLFTFVKDGLQQIGLLGEAGKEAVMPASGGGVQAVTPDGEKAGKLPLARDETGRLSVQVPKDSDVKPGGKVRQVIDLIRNGVEDISREKDGVPTEVSEGEAAPQENAEPKKKKGIAANLVSSLQRIASGDVVGVMGDAAKGGVSMVNSLVDQGRAAANSDAVAGMKTSVAAKLEEAKTTIKEKAEDYAPGVLYQKGLMALKPADARLIEDARKEIAQLGVSVKQGTRELIAEVYPDMDKDIEVAKEKAKQVGAKASELMKSPQAAKAFAKEQLSKAGSAIKDQYIGVVGQESADELAADVRELVGTLKEKGGKASEYVQGKAKPLTDAIQANETYKKVAGVVGEKSDQFKAAAGKTFEGAKTTASDAYENITSRDWSGNDKAEKTKQAELAKFDSVSITKEMLKKTFVSRMGTLAQNYAETLNPRETAKFVAFSTQKLNDYIAKHGEPETEQDMVRFEKDVFAQCKEYLETVEDSYQGIVGFGKKVWDKVVNFFSAFGGNVASTIGDALDGVDGFVKKAMGRDTGDDKRIALRKTISDAMSHYGDFTQEEFAELTALNKKDDDAYIKEHGAVNTNDPDSVIACFEVLVPKVLNNLKTVNAKRKHPKPEFKQDQVQPAAQAGEKVTANITPTAPTQTAPAQPGTPTQPTTFLGKLRSSATEFIKDKFPPATDGLVERSQPAQGGEKVTAEQITAAPAKTEQTHAQVLRAGLSKIAEQTQSGLSALLGKFVAPEPHNVGGKVAPITPAMEGTPVQTAPQPNAAIEAIKSKAAQLAPAGQAVFERLVGGSQSPIAMLARGGKTLLSGILSRQKALAGEGVDSQAIDGAVIPALVGQTSEVASEKAMSQKPGVDASAKVAQTLQQETSPQQVGSTQPTGVTAPTSALNQIKQKITEADLVAKATNLISQYGQQLSGEDVAKFTRQTQKVLTDYVSKNGFPASPEKIKKFEEHVLGKYSTYLENIKNKAPTAGGKIRQAAALANANLTNWKQLASDKVRTVLSAIHVPKITAEAPPQSEGEKAQAAYKTQPDNEKALQDRVINAQQTLEAQSYAQAASVDNEKDFQSFSQKLTEQASRLNEQGRGFFSRMKDSFLGKDKVVTNDTKEGENTDKPGLPALAEGTKVSDHDVLVEIREALYDIDETLISMEKEGKSRWYNPKTWGVAEKIKGGVAAAKGAVDEAGNALGEAGRAVRERGERVGRAAREKGAKAVESVKSFGGGVAGAVGSVASGVASGVIGAAKGVGNAALNVAKLNARMISWGASTTYKWFKEPLDVYVEGEPKPRLYGILFAKGIYFKQKTGKVVKDHSDVDDVIVNDKGQILIAEEELGKLYTKGIMGRAKRLGKGLLRGALSLAGTIGRGVLKTASMVPWVARGMWGVASGGTKIVGKVYTMLGDGPDDVYTPGVEEAVLSKAVMKRGGYISKTTGKPIMRPTQIDGPVLNLKGEEVLSLDQYNNGVFDQNGKPFRTLAGKAVAAIGAIGKGIMKAQGLAWRASKSIAKGLAKGLIGGASGLAKWAMNGFSLEINSAKTREVLEEIRDMLKKKFAGDKAMFGDKDGDGDRDGGWQDILQKNKDKDEAAKQGKEKDKKEKEKGSKASAGKDGKKDDDSGGLLDSLGDLGNTISGLRDLKGVLGGLGKLSGLAKVGTALTGLLGLGGTALSGGALAGTAAAGATAAGAAGATAAGTAAATAAAATAAGAGVAGTAAAGGAVAAGGAAAAGAAATAGVALLPATLIALGIGATAYGAYKLYKWAKTYDHEVLDNLRLVQYGFKYDDKDNYQRIRKLEAMVADATKSGKIDDGKVDLKDMASIFDVGSGWLKGNERENAELRKLLTWYSGRFKPVFLANVAAAQAVNKKEADKALASIGGFSNDEAIKYLEALQVPQQAYDVEVCVDGKYATQRAAQVQEAEDTIRTKLKLKKKSAPADTGSKASAEAKDEKQEKIELSSVGAMSGAAVIKDKAAAKEQGSKVAEFNEEKSLGKSTWSVLGVGAKLGVVGLGLATVGLPATLALGAGYLAMKGVGALVDWSFKHSVCNMDLLRMVQYGFHDKDASNQDAAIEMEQYVMGFVSVKGKGFAIDDTKLSASKVEKIFDVDSSDENAVRKLLHWYAKRFKPVFLRNLEVANQLVTKGDYSKALFGLDKLDKVAKLDYLDQAAFSDGPYQVPCYVLSEKYPHQGSQEVERVIRTIKQLEKLDGVKKSAKPRAVVSTEQSKSEVAFTPAAEGDKVQLQTKQAFGTIKEELVTQADTDEYMDQTTLSALVDLSNLKQDGRLTALQSVYYKAIGLKEMDQAKIKSINALEKVIRPKITFANSEATWSGSAQETLKQVKGEFGITDDGKQTERWTKWLLNRFLPVYLKLFSLYCAYMGSKDFNGDASPLKVSQQHDIAKQLVGLDVWGVEESPWPDYVLNADAKTTQKNLAFLEETVKKEIAIEEQAAARKANSSPKVEGEKATGGIEAGKQPEQGGAGQTQSGGAPAPTGPVGDAPVKSGATGGEAPGAKVGVGELKTAPGEVKPGTPGSNAVRLADSNVKLNGINTAFQGLFMGMAEEYMSQTGKPMVMTDGYRSYEDQVRVKQKWGARAATPGTSLHGYGIAIDADQHALDKAESLGLMRKYGLTRPIGGEPWHVEPIGTQADLRAAKDSQDQATKLVNAGVGKGGGGIGAKRGTKLGTRDPSVSQAIMGASTQPNVKPPEPAAGAPAAGGAPIANATPAAGAGSPAAGTAPGSKAVGQAPAASPADEKGKQTTTAPKQPGGYMGNNQVVSLPEPKKKEESGAMGDSPKPGVKAGTGVPANTAGVTPPLEPSQKKLALDVPKTTGDKEGVKNVIVAAAKGVGVKPENALTTAAIESGFNPNAKAPAPSTASGLFQFVKKTWNAMISTYGKPYGYFPGSVSPLDPQANAIMGAHYLKENETTLKRGGDTDVDAVDLYTAHFMGPNGANTFNSALRANPNQPADQVMPDAAKANKSIFYDIKRPRTLAEVRRWLEKKVKEKAQASGVSANVSTTPETQTTSQTKAAEPIARQAGEAQASPASNTGAPAAAPTKGFGDRDSFLARTRVTAEEMNGMQPVSYKPPVSSTTTPPPAPSATAAAEAAPTGTAVQDAEKPWATSDVYRFNPESIARQDEMVNAKQNALPGVSMKRTEGLLSDQLKVAQEMANILKDIRSEMKEFSRLAGQKKTEEKPPAPAPAPTSPMPKADRGFTGKRGGAVGIPGWEIPTARTI